MATHFRRDTLHNSGLKKARTNLPKEDSVNHETLPDPRRTENKIANCLADVSSKVKEQITSHLYNKSNYLPTNSNTIHLENDKHSVNNSLVDQNQVNISSTSDSYQELDELNSQQTQGNREASELDMNTSLHVGSTETSCSSGPDEQTGVPENQSVDSTGTSTWCARESVYRNLNVHVGQKRAAEVCSQASSSNGVWWHAGYAAVTKAGTPWWWHFPLHCWHGSSC